MCQLTGFTLLLRNVKCSCNLHRWSPRLNVCALYVEISDSDKHQASQIFPQQLCLSVISEGKLWGYTGNSLTSILIYHPNKDLKEVYLNKLRRQMFFIEWAVCIWTTAPLPDHLKVAATSVQINKAITACGKNPQTCPFLIILCHLSSHLAICVPR